MQSLQVTRIIALLYRDPTRHPLVDDLPVSSDHWFNNGSTYLLGLVDKPVVKQQLHHTPDGRLERGKDPRVVNRGVFTNTTRQYEPYSPPVAQILFHLQDMVHMRLVVFRHVPLMLARSRTGP